jgi:hypothetical protein
VREERNAEEISIITVLLQMNQNEKPREIIAFTYPVFSIICTEYSEMTFVMIDTCVKFSSCVIF